ncbi:hypothetical protein AXG93_3158s1110 [Marchantia polymorpha subsp. ruderalis]|uniref:Uncharacterized protein n=1 Tax=Marchantia polymorpha subsp. ruderalis TaxID=1480154 RepID=A0A176VKD0_MARPO|nr:hypothetical protein AXG93_3158s1110 [Marchantia polymorpha subsp. ruderalis]
MIDIRQEKCVFTVRRKLLLSSEFFALTFKGSFTQTISNLTQEGGRSRKEPVIHPIDQPSIYGRLVYGMYDRFKGKPEEEYQEWWTKVHYQLLPLELVLTEDELNLYAPELHDERKNKYFGVFRRNKERPSADAPDWVVAIRETKLSALADLQNETKIVLEKLNSSTLIPLLHYVVWRLGAQYGT